MQEKKHGGKIWPYALGAGALIGLFFLGKKSSAAAPLSPAPAGQQALSTDDMKATAASYSNLLHALLTQKGFSTYPSYVTATSATEEIQDATPGRNRSLNSENQAQTDNFHAFMWDTNAILKYNNFDFSKWNNYVTEFQKAQAYFNTL